MENNEFKNVCIKNRTCYYFDDAIKFIDFDSNNILYDENSNENILIYDILYKTLIGTKHLRTSFDKIDMFFRVYNRTRYLALFVYNAIFNEIRYLISQTSGITYVFSHFYEKIKVDSYDSLSIEKTLTLPNVVIHVKSVLNKDQSHYY